MPESIKEQTIRLKYDATEAELSARRFADQEVDRIKRIAAEDVRAKEQQTKAAQTAGDAAKKAGKDAEDAMKGAAEASSGFLKAILSIQAAQMVLNTVMTVGTEIAKQFNDAAEYVRKLSGDFNMLADTTQEVAARRGVANTGPFVVEEIKKGAQAFMQPAEWRKFQEDFLGRVGGQLEGPGAKLTAQEADLYAQKIAAFSTAKGIAPEMAAEFGASIVSAAQGKQDVAELTSTFGRTFQVLEKSRARKMLLPQLTGIMAWGLSPEEAAEALAVISPQMPGRERTGLENVFKAVRELKQEGLEGQYGISKGMTPFEEIKALSANVAGRVSRGENMEQFLKDAKIASAREFAAIRGLAIQGVGLGGFERFERAAAETPAGLIDQGIAEHRQTQGAYKQAEIQREIAQAEVGERHRLVDRARTEAEARLLKASRLERVNAYDWWLGKTPLSDDMREQMISREALRGARQQLGELGTLNATKDVAASMNKYAADAVLLDLLTRIEQNTRSANNNAPGGRAGPVPARQPNLPMALPGRPDNFAGTH